MIPRVALALTTIAFAALAACDPVKAPPLLSVPPQVVDDIRRDTTDEMMPESRDTLVADLFPDTVDVDGEGAPELLVWGRRSLCGAQNCRVWIYRRTSNGYEPLLHAYGVQTLEPQRATSHGYRDIMTSQHGSATSSELRLYKFDGQRYRLVACYDRSYRALDERGEIQELEKPRVTPIECEKEE